MTPSRKPGDNIIDHFMPDCSDEDREIARERLQQYAGLLDRIAMRQTCEELGLEPVPGTIWSNLFPTDRATENEVESSYEYRKRWTIHSDRPRQNQRNFGQEWLRKKLPSQSYRAVDPWSSWLWQGSLYKSGARWLTSI